MENSVKLLKLLGLGLTRNRMARIVEEHRGDAESDPKAKQTAILRTLKSYFWVANLNSALVLFVGVIGWFLLMKSIWVWAACFLLLSLFVTFNSTEQSLAFRSFKVFKLSLAVFVITACYFSLNATQVSDSIIPNLDPFLPIGYLYVFAAVALTALSTAAVEFFRTKNKFQQIQRIIFILGITGIYLLTYSLNTVRPGILVLLPQLAITAAVFVISAIKRKPALEN